MQRPRIVYLARLSLIFIVGLTVTIRLNAQEPSRTTADSDIVTAPVELDGATLFNVRGVSSLPADVRAPSVTSSSRSRGTRASTLSRFARSKARA